MKVLVNERRRDVLRNLRDECLIVTDPMLMFGIDYRANKGMDLLVARPFPNSRKLYQGEARVGRGGADYGLYRWSTTKVIVDKNE